MIRKTIIKENAYFDSVTLMLISSRVTGMSGVLNAAVMMGTNQNKDLMLDSGLITEEDAQKITPNHMVIGILADNEHTVEEVLQGINDELTKKNTSKSDGEKRVKTQEEAIKAQPDSNFAIISIPGRFAKREVLKAIENNIHVLLFSDNVSIEDEIELKEKALEKGLLMMGPDCGTAIINGVSLGFANVVRQGSIGIVAAAGTGLQEVSTIIDRRGEGVSQAIGTGGRDIKEAVGGKMMLAGIEALKEDANTKVILIVSKPAALGVTEKIYESLKGTSKPKVMCILGGEAQQIKAKGFYFTETLEDAGTVAALLVKGKEPTMTYFSETKEAISSLILKEIEKLRPEQKYLRGLYGGGTLTYETLLIIRDILGDAYSNTPLRKELHLPDVKHSVGHTILDMGDDYFTNGRPHPMIDTRLRTERIKEEASKNETAVILLDCVIGYGAHENPAASLAKTINEVKEKLLKEGRQIVFVASICGTERDPQVRSEQEKKLREAGVIVMESNAQAARMAAIITERGKSLDNLSWEVN